MQRYKALLEKTKTLFWNRWFTTNRRVGGEHTYMGAMVFVCFVVGFTKDMGGCAPDPR